LYSSIFCSRQVEEEEEKEVQMKSEYSRIQRQAEEEEEEPVQTKVEDASIQRQTEEEELEGNRQTWHFFAQSLMQTFRNEYLLAIVNAAETWSPPFKYDKTVNYFFDHLTEELAKFVISKIPVISNAGSLIGAVGSAAKIVEAKNKAAVKKAFKETFSRVVAKGVRWLNQPTSANAKKLKSKIVSNIEADTTFKSGNYKNWDAIQKAISDMVYVELYGNKNKTFSSIVMDMQTYMSTYWDYYLLARLEANRKFYQCKRALMREGQKDPEHGAPYCVSRYVPIFNDVWNWDLDCFARKCAQTIGPMPPGWTPKYAMELVAVPGGGGKQIKTVTTGMGPGVPVSEYERRKKYYQPKLTIGQPGDKYEQEADEVARTVMQREQESAPNSIGKELLRRQGDEKETLFRTNGDAASFSLQRQVEEEESEEETPQTKLNGEGLQRQVMGAPLQLKDRGTKVETKLKELVGKMKDAKIKANAGWELGPLKTLLFDVERELKGLAGQDIPDSAKQHLMSIKGIAQTILTIGLRDNKEWLQAAAIKVKAAADELL